MSPSEIENEVRSLITQLKTIQDAIDQWAKAEEPQEWAHELGKGVRDRATLAKRLSELCGGA